VLAGKKIIVVLPAYNAASTLARAVEDLDREVIDSIVLVDDASADETVEIARTVGLDPIRHTHNRGYGANQKTCYARALEEGGDVVVMVHPDYQYSPRLVVPMAGMVSSGEYDLVLGSRILAQRAVRQGMPWWKYLANRVLTNIENIVIGAKLSEYHTGLRAFSGDLLRALPIERNSEDFVFDNQMIVQALAANARIGELSCPTRYAADSSSIDFRSSVRYGFGVLRTAFQYRIHRMQLRRYEWLEVDPLVRHEAAEPRVAAPIDS
jgi:glycosyltransferase involved in cell wall biosynthesis